MADVPGPEQNNTLVISQATLDETFAAIHSSELPDFRRAEFMRLANHHDPTERMIQEAFGTICGRRGNEIGYQFMVGSFIVTRSLYCEAEAQGVEIRRADVLAVEPQVQAIAGVLDPARAFVLDDIYDEFPGQPALCAAVNGLKSSPTRVGALTMMGVYAHHLIPPGHKLTLRIGDAALPGSNPQSPVTITPIE